MLEAPEAAVIAGQMNKMVTGKTITVVVVGFSPHKFMFSNAGQEEFEKLLIGKTITGARAFGGMVRIDAENTHIVLSDGINLNYMEPGEQLPAKHQLLIGFDDQSCLVASIRMYGGAILFEGDDYDGKLADYYDVAKDKPQVLSDDFTEEYFMGLIEAEDSQNKSAKAFLATGQTIPGLGNGVLQDILFNAGIHPKRKIKDIPEAERREMYHAVKSTLSVMLAAGGRNSETDLVGKPGKYRPFLSKDTLDCECVRCGDIIMKENYMGGAIYYCPGCQKLT